MAEALAAVDWISVGVGIAGTIVLVAAAWCIAAAGARQRARKLNERIAGHDIRIRDLEKLVVSQRELIAGLRSTGPTTADPPVLTREVHAAQPEPSTESDLAHQASFERVRAALDRINRGSD